MHTEDRIEEIKSRIKSAYRELDFALDQLEDVKSECSEFDNEKEELQNQIDVLEEEHQTEKDELEDVINSLEEDNKELRGQVELQQNEIQELENNQAVQ